jgi:iron(III) transport system ATP-binding protein
MCTTPVAPRPRCAGRRSALRAGEIGVLIGPSGCGKTTLLRAVAGLEPVSAGEIRLGGEVVSRAGSTLAPELRRIGMVFQDYALFPHLDVGQNVGFGIHSLPRARARHAGGRGAGSGGALGRRAALSA